MDPGTLGVLILSGVAGVAANVLYDSVKQILKQSSQRGISARLPSGETYDTTTKSASDEEIEMRLDSLRYLGTSTPKLHIERLDLAEDVLLPVIEVLHSRLTAADIDLHIADIDSLPSVNGDRKALQLAVYNLLDNAIKYSIRGTPIMITAETLDDAVKVNISNFGLRLHADEIESVFDRGYRGREAALSDQIGTGLGLSIARTSVVDMGGTLDFKAAEGMGVATIVLPGDPAITTA